MKGDFSRDTFKQEKHYSGVRMQQGRVLLDADWNEQVDIANHRLETEAGDAIGLCGAPANNAGFKLAEYTNTDSNNQKSILIGAGRFYVDGILCENETAIDFTKQKDFPGETLPSKNSEKDTYFLAYLDVWQRHLTVLDDPDLHEVALEAPDTTTRTKTVWQVKLLRDIPADTPCGKEFTDWTNLTKPHARLAAQATPLSSTTNDPCAIVPNAGFRGIANQLYRVEIHTPGPLGTAKFKWSRDNGSITGRIVSLDPNTNTIVICEPPRDDVLAFELNDWVEVISDAQELRSEPGILVRLNSQALGTSLIYDPDSAVPAGRLPELASDQAKGYKVRKWHPTKDAEISTSSDWIKLTENDGIEVRFEAKGDESFKSGDYWFIPARTVTGNVDWPVENKLPKFLAPSGIKHHFCRLAICKLDKDGNWHVDDCRPIFSPLTHQINLFYLSGDGQEAMPGEMLAQPLRVGAPKGLRGIKVKFKILQGEGCLVPNASEKCQTEDELKKDEQRKDALEVEIDSAGVAQCFWRLGKKALHQQVEATLLNNLGVVAHLPIRFNANLSLASQVAYSVPSLCNNLPAMTPTVVSQFKETISGWPKANEHGNVSAQYLLDTFLCALNARHLPFLDECEDARYELGIRRTVDGALQTNAAHIAANHTDRRQFVPLLAQTLPYLRYRDGRHHSFAVPYPTGLVFDGRYIWAGSAAETRFSRIDETADDSIERITSIETTGLTYYGAFDGERVWFTSPYKLNANNERDQNNQVFFIDTKKVDPKKEKLEAIPVTVGDLPMGITFDGSYIWVANYISKTVSIIDINNEVTENDQKVNKPVVLRTITLRGEDGQPVAPTNLAFDGSYIWIGGHNVKQENEIKIEEHSIFRVKKEHKEKRLFEKDGKKIEEEVSIWENPELVNDQLEIFPRELTFDGAHVWLTNCFDESEPEEMEESAETKKNLPIYKIDVHTLAVAKLDGDSYQSHGAIFDGRNMWLLNASAVASHLLDVHFVNLKTGWAVGNDSTILFTNDGGKTWQRKNVPPGLTENLNAVFFSDAQKGWVVGNNGTIRYTTNGGNTWEKPQTPEEITVNLYNIHFLEDALTGWVVGNNSTILATVNGGKNWEKQNIILKPNELSFEANLYGVYFIDKNSGWAVGSNATILATSDGKNWGMQNPPAGVKEHLRDVYFVDQKQGCAVGKNGTILITVNGGIPWIPKKAIEDTSDGGKKEITAHLNSVQLYGKFFGWAVGNDSTILITSDSGFSWKKLQELPQEVATHLRGGAFFVTLNNENEITSENSRVVGNDATILTLDSTSLQPGGWVVQPPPKKAAGLMHKINANTNIDAGSIALDRAPLSGVFDGTHLWLSLANHRVQKWLVG